MLWYLSIRLPGLAVAAFLGVGSLLGAMAAGADAPSGFVQDWPMWGGRPDRTMVSPGKGPPTTWNYDPDHPADNRNIQWSVELGSKSYGTPVVCGGVVYVGTNNFGPFAGADTRGADGKPIDGGVLLALREADGSLLWQRYTSKLPAGRVNDWPGEGLCSSPCVEAETQRLWYCTNRCEVVCLDVREANRGGLEDGAAGAAGLRQPRVVWSVDMMKELGVFPHNMTNCSPAVWNDFVYVITANGVEDTHKHVVAPNAPAIVCFDKNTGKVVWKDNSPGDKILHSQWSNPSVVRVGEKTLVLAPLGDGWVYAYDAPTGKVVWKFDCNRKDSIYPQGGRNDIIATPVVSEGRLYLATGQDPEHSTGYADFWCMLVNGAGDVSPEIDNPDYKPPVPGQDLAASAGKVVSKGIPNPNSKVVWHFGPGRKGDSEPGRMHRSMAAACVYKGLVFLPDFAGYLHCLDAETGGQHWVDDVESEVWNGALACDGKVYLGSGDGNLLVYAADRAMKRFGTYDMGSSIFTTPVYADGTLYVMTQQRLFAIRADPAPAPAGAVAGDWPQWRGPDRSNVSAETGLLQEWPEGGPPLLWTVTGLGGGFAPVSLQGGRAYTLGRRSDQEVAVALDRDSGAQVWVAPLWPAARDHTAMPWLNQRQPTADGPRVYVTSADGDLACLDSATGKERWRKNYRDDFHGRKSGWGYCDYPLVDGDNLVCVPGGSDAVVIALNKFSGEVVWKCSPGGSGAGTPSAATRPATAPAAPSTAPARAPAPQGPARGFTPSHSSLVVAEVGGVRQYVYHFMDGLAGVSADGQLLWSGAFRGRTASVYTPIVRGDRVFCASGYGAGCTLVQIVPPAAPGAGWKTEVVYQNKGLFQSWHGSTILGGDHVYTFMDQSLACLDFASGQVGWRQGKREVFGANQVSTLWADGRMYCLATDGTTALVEATPKGYALKGKFTLPQPSKGRAAPPPVVADGRLYLRDQDGLHCYDVTRDRQWRRLATTRPVTLPTSLPSTPDGAQGVRSEVPTLPTRPKRPGDPDAVYVPTPEDVVERMLTLAGVGKADVVYDLGSGDGRVVLAAARRGARGVGVEVNPDLIAESRENARKSGVGERVSIRQGDLFDADFRDATVVALYLLPEVNARLLPRLRQLRPGTRVVSHQFGIEGVEPARVVKYTPEGESEEHTLYLWVAPLAEGR